MKRQLKKERFSRESGSKKTHKRSLKKIIWLGIILFILILIGGELLIAKQFDHDLRSVYSENTKGTSVPEFVSSKKLQRLKILDYLNLYQRAKQHHKYNAFKQEYYQQQDIISHLNQDYDTNNFYRIDLKQQDLNILNNSLYKITNSQFYYKYKNKVDTLNVWLLETQRANETLRNLYKSYKDEHKIKIIEMKVALNLIHRRDLKNSWQPIVEQIAQEYSSSESEKDENQKQKEKDELENLEKAPLTSTDFVPGEVNFKYISKFDEKAKNALINNQINTSMALYINVENKKMDLMRYDGHEYEKIENTMTVTHIDPDFQNTQWTIKSLAENKEGKALCTNSQNSSFGLTFDVNSNNYQYFYKKDIADSSNDENDSSKSIPDWTDIDYSNLNFNTAKPLFWLQNLKANSLIMIRDKNLGIITTDNDNENTVNLSNENLNKVFNNLPLNSKVLIE